MFSSSLRARSSCLPCPKVSFSQIQQFGWENNSLGSVRARPLWLFPLRRHIIHHLARRLRGVHCTAHCTAAPRPHEGILFLQASVDELIQLFQFTVECSVPVRLLEPAALTSPLTVSLFQGGRLPYSTRMAWASQPGGRLLYCKVEPGIPWRCVVAPWDGTRGQAEEHLQEAQCVVA